MNINPFCTPPPPPKTPWVCPKCGTVHAPFVQRCKCDMKSKGVVNYRELLIKYITHVGECEGTSFIPRDAKDAPRNANHNFSRQEIDILHELEKQISQLEW